MFVTRGLKSTARFAVAMACSFVTRTCDCWQLFATKKAATRTATSTRTCGQVGRIGCLSRTSAPASAAAGGVIPGLAASNGWTEGGPDVREEHDDEHNYRADDRDRKHRHLERLHVRLERMELDLSLAAAVVDHGVSYACAPGCGGG